MKRFLNCASSDFYNIKKDELLESIGASEGRTIVSEVNAAEPPAIDIVTNAEIAKGSGADMILFNCLDLNDIDIKNLPETEEPIKLQKELCGIPIGLNLEPVDKNISMREDRLNINEGRQATAENFEKLNKLGFDFVCITGNPGVGVSHSTICEAIKLAKDKFDGVIIAGKMHGAGAKEKIIDIKSIEEYIESGVDIVLIPAPGTVQGSTLETVKEAIDFVHSKGKLVMTSNGTSQESSDISTVKNIGLMSKMAGSDIHHIGDAGGSGIAPYQNIYNLSLTVRGLRHTIKRIASSAKR